MAVMVPADYLALFIILSLIFKERFVHLLWIFFLFLFQHIQSSFSHIFSALPVCPTCLPSPFTTEYLRYSDSSDLPDTIQNSLQSTELHQGSQISPWIVSSLVAGLCFFFFFWSHFNQIRQQTVSVITTLHPHSHMFLHPFSVWINSHCMHVCARSCTGVCVWKLGSVSASACVCLCVFVWAGGWQRRLCVTASVGETERYMHITPYITVEAVRIRIHVTALVSSESQIQAWENKQSPPSYYLSLFSEFDV